MSPHAGEKPAVILIGADGFIGTAVSQDLRAAGWNVIPTVFRRPPQDGERTLDVTDKAAFSVLPPGHPVINAAGLPDQGFSASLMRRVHVGGMQNLLAWAEHAEVPHLVQMSSITVYGNATVGTGRTEAATRRITRNPISSSLPYGRTKARAEELLEHSGLPWSALRLPAVYGPGDSFLTPQLRRLLTESGRPLPPGGGKPVSIMPIDALGPLLVRVLNHGPLNRALNAAGAHVSWKEILDAYAAAWNLTPELSYSRRLADFLNFSDPGMQMAAYYGSFGAGFPDDVLRRILKWEPTGNWKDTVVAAAMEYTKTD